MNPWIQLLRPRQWLKSGFVFAPLVFSLHLSAAQEWAHAVIAALCFTGLACAIYILNDLTDREENRLHPHKRHRPLAAGSVPPKRAAWLSAGLALGALAACFLLLPFACVPLLAGYGALQIAYSLRLKHIAVLDILIIASGFVARVVMGGLATGIPLSPWIILTTFMLALFLASGKRYHEYSLEEHMGHRPSLRAYSLPLLDRIIGISCAGALLSYAMYCVNLAQASGSNAIVYTLLFVTFGLLRYLQWLYVFNKGGAPEDILLHDKLFFANGLCWLSVTLLIMAASGNGNGAL